MDEFRRLPPRVISLPNPPIEDFATPGQGLGRWRASPTTPWRSFAKNIPTVLPASSPALSPDATSWARWRRPSARSTNLVPPACRFSRRSPATAPWTSPCSRPLYAAMAQARPADLAASRPHRSHAGLCRRAEIPRFEMWWCFGWPYDTSVAMVRPRLLWPVRPLSEPEDHHPPSRRHDPVLRRPHRSRPRRSRPTHHR